MIAVDLSVSWNMTKRNQWANFRDELRVYLQKCLAVYRASPPDKQAELRAKNWLLADLLYVIGE